MEHVKKTPEEEVHKIGEKMVTSEMEKGIIKRGRWTEQGEKKTRTK